MREKIPWGGLCSIIAALMLVASAGRGTHPVGSAAASISKEDNAIKIGERRSIYSAILKEDRPYWVHLPQSYSNQDFAPKRYPVLYLLDGDAHFHSVSGVMQFMSANINGNLQIPELIIVAIPNTARTRDLTPTHTTKGYNGKENPSQGSSGGGESFLRFLSEELIPHIEAQYRTQPYRILVGHSYGGLFALHAFLHRPQVFQAHLAIDPSLWWDDQVLLRQAQERLQTTNDFRGPVYISVANNDGPKTGEQACREFAALLQGHPSAVFRSTMNYFAAEDHGSVPLLSLYHGLLFVFDGYKPPAGMTESLSALTNYFANLSARWGWAVRPPEDLVNGQGWYTLTSKRQTNGALEWLKFNRSIYPDSPNVHESLAEAYELIGDKPLAMENFKMAIKLRPENRYAAERVRRLTPSSEKAAGPLGDGVYQVNNQLSGQALEVAGASTADGVFVGQGKYTNGLHQQWRFESQGDGYYQVTALHSGKALDVTALSSRNGAPVIQWKTNGGPNQIWQVVPEGNGTYRLLNEHSRFALQVTHSSITNGPSLEQWEWQARDNQRWRIKRISSPGK